MVGSRAYEEYLPSLHELVAELYKQVSYKLAKALADRSNGLVFDDQNAIVSEYLSSWLKGSVRQSTFARYEIAVCVHASLLSAG